MILNHIKTIKITIHNTQHTQHIKSHLRNPFLQNSIFSKNISSLKSAFPLFFMARPLAGPKYMPNAADRCLMPPTSAHFGGRILNFDFLLAIIICLLPTFRIQNSAAPAAELLTLNVASNHYLFTTNIQKYEFGRAGGRIFSFYC